MEIERKKVTLVVDPATLPGELEKLGAEGWTIDPAIKPVAVYNLVRQKSSEIGGVLKMTIDDTKIKILRNGQLIDG